MLNADEIEAILRGGRETTGFELKGPGNRSDTHHIAKVAHAALGLGNLRDGGHIVIGIDDKDPASLGPGLEQGDLASWLSYDDVARKLANYADPPLEFDIAQIELSSGAKVAVMQVYEFRDYPHICAKAYEGVMEKGQIYVRPRKTPETSKIADSVEMRDLIDLATEKGVRRFVERARGAGLDLAGTAGGRSDDEDDYEEEREAGWT
jgi:predicted HTH transcriptional regulator